MTGGVEDGGIATLTIGDTDMDRILTLPRRILNNPFTQFFRDLREARRIARDAARLETMPRERLEDMGIAPRSAANHRDSGQAGRIAQPTLW
ncbi:hypothetical protein SAMN05421759_11737 [Roseivivax lentus]|uniref:Uncharacterized protein n=1 Tax=Roseivivax lentus TaxID=633194 RepID=A0A1N7PLQ7_9RHOB|nr:hypothetical protein [Roseivivax lentus]SIT11532.1 hypothetical protein SAMN05421759_11737 [Roseivivax lentus]